MRPLVTMRFPSNFGDIHVVVDERLPPGYIWILGETDMGLFTDLNERREASSFPLTVNPNGTEPRRDGQGRLHSMSKEDLIAEVQKLQRKARVHKQTITHLNRQHTEDLRLLRDYREDNDRLTEERDTANDKLIDIDNALRG